MNIERRVEGKRGCGFRKTGPGGYGLYFVGPPFSRVCGRLPFPLRDCPTCGGGVRQHRAAQWIEPRVFFGGERGTVLGDLLSRARGALEGLDGGGLHELKSSIDTALSPPHECTMNVCPKGCSMRPDSLPDRAILMWVGEKHYPSAEAFLLEANQMWVSKRIRALPRGWTPGCLVYLAHPNAVMPWHRGWYPSASAEAPETDLHLLASDCESGVKKDSPCPGVFCVFAPKLEVVLDTDDPSEAPQYAHELYEKFGDAVAFVKVERAAESVQLEIGGEE